MNIQNLVFFKTDGLQIQTQKETKITFQIIGQTWSDGANYGWREDAEGYCSIDEYGELKEMILTNPGVTYGVDFTETTFPEGVDDIEEYYKEKLIDIIDEIIFTVETDDVTYTQSFTASSYDLTNIFDIEIGKRDVGVRNKLDDTPYTWEFYIKSIQVYQNVAYTFFRKYFDNNYGENFMQSIYPGTSLTGQIMMEPVSTGLASVQTIYVLEKVTDSSGNVSYVRPKSDTQVLRFEFDDDSNAKIVKYAENYYKEDDQQTSSIDSFDYSKVYWSNYAVFDLPSEYDEYTDYLSTQPLVFTIGFVADEEGCYQDVLNILTADYFYDTDKTGTYHTLGYFSVKNETIGEDVRYRTLFANFGIPDPKDYPNLFKDVDINEAKPDWEYLNKKSKELFLTYREIFPYVGTYKALINAVNFLGYDDVYFKEWYQFFNGEDSYTISYKSLDISTKETLHSKLARANVDLEDFLNWKKLNKLSMFYLINREIKPYEILNNKRYYIPTVENDYSYVNLEVLAKLYALKKWLTTYILNVNCQIIDITGDGIYFERMKEAANQSAPYTVFDFKNEEYLTPYFNIEYSKTDLFRSAARLRCEIKEINNYLTIDNITNKQFSDFVVSIFDSSVNKIDRENWDNVYENYFSDDGSVNLDQIKNYYLIGKNILNPTNFESLEFNLTVDCSCGTLKNGVGYYSGDKFVYCPLVVKDNEIFNFGYTPKEVEFLNLPKIYIEGGKLRKPYGNWNNNVEYQIKGFFDAQKIKTRFCIQSIDGTLQEVTDDYLTLVPKSPQARLRYSSKNKYGVPMLLIKGYDTYNNFLADTCGLTLEEHEFILEIEEGFINLEEKIYDFNESEILDGTTCNAKLYFEQDYDENNANEQSIFIRYEYKTPRYSIINFDETTYQENIKAFFQTYETNIAKIEDLYSQTENIDFDTIEYNLKSDLDIERDYTLFSLLNDKKDFDEKYSTNVELLESKINDVNLLKVSKPEYESIYNKQISLFQEKIDNYDNSKELFDEEYEINLAEIKEKWLNYYINAKKNELISLIENLETEKDTQIKKIYAIDVFVNHIGEYSLIAKVVDGYNVPYVAKGINTVSVNGVAPDVLSGLFDYDASVDASALAVADARPWFIPEYQKNLISFDGTLLTYYDYSYYFDTPKKGDYIHLSNTSEKVDYIENNYEYDSSYGTKFLKIVMNDENPQNQNIFNLGAQIYLVFIDENSGTLITGKNFKTAFAGPYTVIEFKPIPTEDKQLENDNYVILTWNEDDNDLVYTPIADNIINFINNNSGVLCYAILATEKEFNYENVSVSEDDESDDTVIKIKDTYNGSNLMLQSNQCVKILYSSLTLDGYSTDNKTKSKVAKLNENYISGATYKLTNAYYDYDDFTQTYVLDGKINIDLINNSRTYKNGIYNYLSETPEENLISVPYKVKTVLAPAHQHYVDYIFTAITNADEDNTEGSVSLDTNWVEYSYIDNTFGFRQRKFDTNVAFEDWSDKSIDTSVYYYSKPLKVDIETDVHIKSNDDKITYNTLNGKYMSIWSVYQNEYNEKDREYLIYELINDEVDVNLEKLGEYHFELTTIDSFGNLLNNNYQGFIKTVN